MEREFSVEINNNTYTFVVEYHMENDSIPRGWDYRSEDVIYEDYTYPCIDKIISVTDEAGFKLFTEQFFDTHIEDIECRLGELVEEEEKEKEYYYDNDDF